MPQAVEIRARNIEEVVVHPDDARYDGISLKIQNRCALGRGHVGALLDCCDPSAFNHDILIFGRRRPCAINNPHVCEEYFGGLHPDKLLHGFREFGLLGYRSKREQKERKNTRQDTRRHEGPPQDGEIVLEGFCQRGPSDCYPGQARNC